MMRKYYFGVQLGTADKMERFFGGSPAAVIVKLIIASIIIGVMLSFFGFQPRDIYEAIRRLVRWISSLGFDAVDKVFQYFLIGATIVVPIWLLSRFLGLIGAARNDRDRR